MSWREHLDELVALLGPEGVITSDAALFTYEADALTLDHARPDVVALPRSTDEVVAVLRWARDHGLPVTTRAAGTGLSGGATPVRGGLVLSVNRMDQLLSLDPERLFAWVQPAHVNLHLSQKAAPHGLHYAPDPSSQQVSTIGGNVAANSGGPHCLKYGVTLNSVLGMVVVLHDGSVVTLGGEGCDSPGVDLAMLLTGSEGTLGVITEVCVRLLPKPEAVGTMMFDFVDVRDACRAVSQMVAEGIVPAAMEIMDTHTIGVVEAWIRIGLPTDAGAILLIEVDGPAVSLPAWVERIGAIAREHHARTARVAKDEAERVDIWRGRKSAFGAYGRLREGFYIMDGVVPRTRLADALDEIYRIARERGLEAGNVFHAGDGNLHPHLLFDPDDPVQQRAALEGSFDILRMCIRMGGTISGEHGIGIEKKPLMREMFSPPDLALMARVKAAFDPDGLMNPGKVLPRDDDPEPHGAPPNLGGRAARPDLEGPWT
jgi:glycolate oxidase